VGESREPSDSSLAGKVVLVAGAGSGMGRATALAVAREGARTALLSRNREALNAVNAAIEGSGGQSLVVPADATDPSAVAGAVERVLKEYGRIDVLVNSVGDNIRERALNVLTIDGWSHLIAANLTAAYVLTQAVLPVFRRQGGGLLIHISSAAAKRPDLSGVAYQASKTGLLGLAHGTMEEERKNGIRVTVILPGLTDTPLLEKRPVPTPPEVLARALRPEDVAEVCQMIMRLPSRAYVPELLIYPSLLG
jgi:NAD(P)-dependent dehydrogenase (short-subunit alcohol dehydrogenase family)